MVEEFSIPKLLVCIFIIIKVNQKNFIFDTNSHLNELEGNKFHFV